MKAPDQAPVADPGLTKKCPSYSSAWKLQGKVSVGSKRDRGACNARVCVPRNEDVDVHLSRQCTERIKVSSGYALVTVNDSNFDW